MFNECITPYLGRQFMKEAALQWNNLTAKVVEGDVLNAETFNVAKGLGDMKFGLLALDPPYGLNLHLKNDAVSFSICKAICFISMHLIFHLKQVFVTKNWDDKFFDDVSLKTLLDHINKADIMAPAHTLVTFCPTLNVTEYKLALEGKGYKNVTPFVWAKDEVPHCTPSRGCTSLEQTFLVAFKGSPQTWNFDVSANGEDSHMSVS